MRILKVQPRGMIEVGGDVVAEFFCSDVDNIPLFSMISDKVANFTANQLRDIIKAMDELQGALNNGQ